MTCRQVSAPWSASCARFSRACVRAQSGARTAPPRNAHRRARARYARQRVPLVVRPSGAPPPGGGGASGSRSALRSLRGGGAVRVPRGRVGPGAIGSASCGGGGVAASWAVSAGAAAVGGSVCVVPGRGCLRRRWRRCASGLRGVCGRLPVDEGGGAPAVPCAPSAGVAGACGVRQGGPGAGAGVTRGKGFRFRRAGGERNGTGPGRGGRGSCRKREVRATGGPIRSPCPKRWLHA